MTTTATTAPPTTQSGKPKPTKLPVDDLRLEQATAVTRTLDSIEDPKKRIQKACQVIDQAAEFLGDKMVPSSGKLVRVDGNEKRMKKMALSLALIEGARGVSDVAGISRYGFYKMTVTALGEDWDRPSSWDETVKARAKSRGVRYYRDAAVELPQLAREVYEARVRKDVATKYRDRMIVEFAGEGMTHDAIAQLIGRERSRVTQILSAHTKSE